MKNRDIYQRDPSKITLLNNGVATMTDALTIDERRTLRFEIEHFVCEGEYRRGLVRILDSYVSSQGQPEQPAAWVSGFFGSGKSHLAKMLRFLWTDYTFPEDGASARGLARLPNDVRDLLQEISTLGKRGHGLHAAAETLGAGAGDSVRFALLGIAFKSAELPESFPQARFCLWLKKNDLYDPVCAAVEAQGRDFRRELNDLYVSPLIAKALLLVDSNFAANEKEAKAALRAQFPKPKDITTDEFVNALQDTLAPNGDTPCTVIILDEVQQYIGEDTGRSYVVQEVVEACSKRFGDRLLFLGTGQTALSGTPALQRLQGRFTVNVELSDTDVETVIRRVVLAKRPDRVNDVKSALEANAGELDRHLRGTKIGPRHEDKSILIEDYPLLPVRRRFWEHILRAVDRAGTAGQLRTQLRIVYDAIRRTAGQPVGSVVPADFLFEEISANLLQSGVLLREANESILGQDNGTSDGRLKSRLCALVFLIRKLPREAGVDIGLRAAAGALADLLVEDLVKDGPALRGQIPKLLEELVAAGTLMKLDDEYSLQTRESSEWEAEFRNRQTNLVNDPARMSSKWAQLLGSSVQDAIGSVKLLHGKCKEPRKLALHFGAEPPQGTTHEIPVWIRDGWGADEKNVIADARAAGPDSSVIHVFVRKSRADALARVIAAQSAAKESLEYKGVPSTPEGIEARQGMET
ncbi:MAG TPA: BREX system P-loop protein BrxC, partial [Rhodospirillales bacterium]|nr:BREX system P-loop protein BrxC [Rhodospirillales bacterium]